MYKYANIFSLDATIIIVTDFAKGLPSDKHANPPT